MTSRLLVHKFIDETFDARIVLLCGPLEKAKAWEEKQTKEEADDYELSAVGMAYTMKTRTVSRHKEKIETQYVVWIEKRSDYYTLVHEVVHLVSAICRDKGVKHDPENHEVFAYMIESWTRRMWKVLSRAR